ncbi:MAG: T9SS type A sorting domain-containing protein [Bacteroidota bacterium]
MKTPTKSIAGKILITLITILNLTFSSSIRAYDNPLRGMYVNGLITQGILGSNVLENALLQNAKDNHISYLILYELNSVWGNTGLETNLCNFITKAKSLYCISKIGAAGECNDFFTNLNSFNALMITPAYTFNSSQLQTLGGNTSLNFVQQQYTPADGGIALMAEIVKSSLRMLDFNSTCTYKIDALVTEHEFWNAAPPCPGTHCLCQIYTDPTDDYLNDYIPLLDYMNVVKSMSTTYPLTVETYIGWFQNDAVPDLTQVQQIDIRTDFILLHCYVGNPSGAYGYANAVSRLAYFGDATTKPLTKICPIFSVEPGFMGPWVNSDPTTTGQTIFAAERQFLDDMAANTNHAYGDNIIIPGGFIYFESGYMPTPTNNALYPANNVLFEDPAASCSGSSVTFHYVGPYEAGTTFNWVFGDGTTTSVVNPAYASQDISHTYTNAGNYTAGLTLVYPAYTNDPTWLGGCSSYTYSRTVVVNGTSISPSGSTTFCQGQSVTLTATGNNFYWTTPTGTHPITQSISANVDGNYSVTVTNFNGCATSTATIHITVNPNPTVTVTPTDITCNGDNDGQACATASGGTLPYTYSWSCTGTQSNNCLTAMPPTNSCTVTVTDAYNCSVTSSSFAISEPALLTANVNVLSTVSCPSLCDGSAEVIPVGGTAPYNYLWSDGEASAIAITLCKGTNISVIVTDAHGCSLTINNIAIDDPANSCNELNNYCDAPTLASNVGTSFPTGTVGLHNDFIVDADFTINGSDVLIDPNVNIFIDPNVTLTIQNASHLHACTDMWSGITLTDPSSTLIVDGSGGTNIIEDAENGIYSDVGGELHVSKSTFNNNFHDINLSNADYSSSVINDDNNFSGGILTLAPHSGQMSFAHIFLQKVQNLTIGDALMAAGRNIFSSSTYAIHATDCDRLLIADNTFNSPTVGVYLYTDPTNTSFHTHYSQVGQWSVSSSNIFNTCRRAVWIVNQDIRVHYNEFNDCSLGIFSQSCFGRYGFIYNNIMHNAGTGISCLNNTYTELDITDNTITTTTSLTSVGIVVNDLPSLASYTSSLNNIISSYGSGIIYRNNVGSMISGNTISLLATSNTPLTNLDYGVRIENCSVMYLTCNTVTGVDGHMSNFNIEKSGISATFSPKCTFDCNSADYTTHGLQFLANCQSAFIKGNSMYHLINGLTLGAVFNGGWVSGVIGSQTFFTDQSVNYTYGNHFLGWGSGIFLNASMHVINSLATAYWINPALIYDPPLAPFTFQDVGGFTGSVPFFPFPTVLPIYQCPTSCVNHLLAPKADGGIHDYLQSLSNNSNESDEQTNNLKWSLRQGLFEQIKSDSTLLDSFPVLQTFFDSIPATSEGKFIDVKELLSSIKDSTVAPDSASKETIIQQAEIKNNSANDVMIYEYNRKVINTITLETIVRNNFNFSELQKETVEGIAFQCPYVGGTAVIEARTIMQNWNDSAYFDDYNLCNAESYFRIAFEKNESKINYLSVYPNPASEFLNVNYISSDALDAVLHIHDITGRRIYSRNLTSSSGQIQIETSSFAPGSYLIEISTDSNQILRSKFNIVK